MSENSTRWARVCLIAGVMLLAMKVARGDEIDTDGISGRHFRAIEAAMPELARFHLNIEDYWIEVTDWHESILLTFGTKGTPKSWRGCFGEKPCFSVELSRSDLHVVRSQWDR